MALANKAFAEKRVAGYNLIVIASICFLPIGSGSDKFMKTKISIKYLICVMTFYSTGCKQVYEPPALKSNNNFLVEDGFIDGGLDSTFIILTRTRARGHKCPFSVLQIAFITYNFRF
jgi:hypothetical protein